MTKSSDQMQPQSKKNRERVSSKNTRPGPAEKISKQTIDVIVDAISRCAPYEIAASYAGIGERTLYEWLEQGQKDRLENKETLYADLSLLVKREKARRALVLLEKIDNGADNWQARAWILERDPVWRSLYGKDAYEIQKLREDVNILKDSIAQLIQSKLQTVPLTGYPATRYPTIS